jgi:two-component system NtrC family sensor kinase
MRFFQTLTFRVLVGSFFLLISLFGLYTYYAVNFHSTQMMEVVRNHAIMVSNLIKNSTHYSMLQGRNQDAYEIMKRIAAEHGVEGIWIYNNRGKIMFSTDRSQEGSVVNMHAEACDICHVQGRPLRLVETKIHWRFYPASQGKGYRILGLINPIYNEPSCFGCHPREQTVLGVLDVRMSLQEMDINIAAARAKLILYAVAGTLVVMLASTFYFTATVHRRVRTLIEGTRQISSGNLDHRILASSRDEIGRLAKAFNEMATSLQKAEQENRTWSQTLEKRVEEKTAELKQIHSQMLQVEKMASLGKLSATVAHELNNPLAGILNYTKLITKRIGRLEASQTTQSTLEDLELISSEVQRCGNIVKNLLMFSKRQVGEFGLISVAEVVDRAVRLMQHHFKISNVVLQTDLSIPDALLMCDENQIQQALVALLVNAVEAMPSGGMLKISALRDAAQRLCLTIEDTGIGIRSEDLPHLFEPFFSTKREGQGVGLGLSVVYGIMERHDGTVSVQSEPGKGTVFTLAFPPAEKQNSQLEAAKVH